MDLRETEKVWRSFPNGFHRVESQRELQELKSNPNVQEIKVLHLSAAVARDISLRQLATMPQFLKKLQEISIADDYISDADVSRLKAQLLDSFSNTGISVRVAYDGVVDGKHGK